MNKQTFSPEKYIRQNGRKLPIEKCLVAENAIKNGVVVCIIIRKQPSGLFSFASFVVDRFCLGIKDAMANCNYSKIQIDDLLARMSPFGVLKEVPAAYFHNLVYGALDYAEDLGFSPNESFDIAEHLLDPDLADEGIDDIEFGYNGKPLYIQGPFDDANRIIKTLNSTVGEGNYEFVVEGGGFRG